jgi:hypothetical protein
VFLEGVQVDSVTTSAGQTVTKTYRVSVVDGQLNLRLADLGGSDYWAMINGLDVVYVGPDLTGPRVVAADPTGSATGPVDRIRVTFDEVIDAGSFTIDDVVLLEGPAGPLAPIAVNSLGNGEFEVTFAPQNVAGIYRLEIGPHISDASGNLMDQDGDGTPGEAVDDRFLVSFTLAPGPEFAARFDFGTTTSPVADGYTAVTRYDRHTAAAGYGWQIGSAYDISRGSGTDLTRDVNFTHDATFALDLANGAYQVIVTLGDTSLAHDLVGVFLEGVQVDTVTTTAGQTVTKTYQATVSDGQLNLRLADLGGSDYWAMINGLEVVPAGGGAQAAAAASAGAARLVDLALDRPIGTGDEDTWLLARAQAATRSQDSVAAQMARDDALTALFAQPATGAAQKPISSRLPASSAPTL